MRRGRREKRSTSRASHTRVAEQDFSRHAARFQAARTIPVGFPLVLGPSAGIIKVQHHHRHYSLDAVPQSLLIGQA
jgi:hypothetical protein